MFFSSNTSNPAAAGFAAVALSVLMLAAAIIPASPSLTVFA